MIKERDLEIEIERILSDAEQKWDYSLFNEIRRNMLTALEFIEKKHSGEEEIDMIKVLDEYQKDKEAQQRKNVLDRGYFFFMDVVNTFAKRPEYVWEIYDKAENKKDFFHIGKFDYSFGKDGNLYAFARYILANVFVNNNLTIDDVEKMSLAQRMKYIEKVHKYFGETLKTKQESIEKTNIIETLKNTFEELERLGALEISRKQHNEKMQRAGADILTIPDDLSPIGENGEFYGEDLNKLSIFKLKAMLAHYLNRLEKVKENIGLGMFLVTNFSKQNDFFRTSFNKLTEEEIKENWKRFYTMSRLLDDEMDVIYGAILNDESKGDRRELLVSEVYEMIQKKYENVWPKFFGSIDMKDEFFVFMTTNGFVKRNLYLLKDDLIEQLLAESYTENLNWGIIDESEDNRPILTKRVLVGIDIPGMNFPLRLHFHLSKLKEIALNYMKTTEVPLYAGNEDITYMGKNVGAEIYKPIDTKQSTVLKKLLKTKKASNLLKHVACMQLPNMVKKLNDGKYFKRGEGISKTIPDFIDLITSKIRRTGKALGKNQE